MQRFVLLQASGPEFKGNQQSTMESSIDDKRSEDIIGSSNAIDRSKPQITVEVEAVCSQEDSSKHSASSFKPLKELLLAICMSAAIRKMLSQVNRLGRDSSDQDASANHFDDFFRLYCEKLLDLNDQIKEEVRPLANTSKTLKANLNLQKKLHRFVRNGNEGRHSFSKKFFSDKWVDLDLAKSFCRRKLFNQALENGIYLAAQSTLTSMPDVDLDELLRDASKSTVEDYCAGLPEDLKRSLAKAILRTKKSALAYLRILFESKGDIAMLIVCKMDASSYIDPKTFLSNHPEIGNHDPSLESRPVKQLKVAASHLR